MRGSRTGTRLRWAWVYGTALRLVWSGDSLLRRRNPDGCSRTVPEKHQAGRGEVMLGGWLHRGTFNVARP